MSSGADPRAGDEDLTAKARIRNAALDLYAEHGEDRTSMRAIASRAGVTVGLVAHHFGNRDGVREAVEQLVVGYFRAAIRQAPAAPTREDVSAAPQAPAAQTREDVSAARVAAVAAMLERNPVVVDYLRRALLDPSGRSRLLERMTDLARDEMAGPDAAGDAPDSRRVVDVMIRELGRLFLQPMFDAMWTHLEGVDAPSAAKPVLTVATRETE